MKKMNFIIAGKRTICALFFLLIVSNVFSAGEGNVVMKPELKCLMTAKLPVPVGQLRISVMNQGKDKKQGFAVIYGEDKNIDPWQEAFFYPSSSLKISAIDADGKILWTKDLGRGVVPGANFCPMCAFDLDGDGIDEIYYVGNSDDYHPLKLSNYKLVRLDGMSGQQTGDWKWPSSEEDQSISWSFRNSIFGGYVKGKPVLITEQGVYGTMMFQAYNPGMEIRWERVIKKTDPGARGCHRGTLSDMNQDGVQELIWSERCIELDKGTDLFCADLDSWQGHSDVAQPVWDVVAKKWGLYTCRETPGGSPRVCFFDNTGKRIWGHVDEGHIDQGYVARIGDNYSQIATALKVGTKTFERDGIVRTGTIEYNYDVLTGKEVKLPFTMVEKRPVDIDGDGYHELIFEKDSRSVIINRTGEEIASFEGTAILVGKLVDLPGEQIVTLNGGEIKVLTDVNAKDSPFAMNRYNNPLYKVNIKNADIINGI
jgi:hypothetical protein